MAIQLMNLPVNIPWKLVDASPDMMVPRPIGDLESGTQYQWKSSLAIYAYEPKPEDLDEALCDQRITFLKVTCSITGYQPSGDEIQAVLESYSDVSASDLEREIGNYFACYGVLLNVSVFPGSVTESTDYKDLPPQKDYPHIIDFEPKRRDLYQAATESGEILTASKSGVQTDKSFTSTQTSETGVKVGADVPLNVKGGAKGVEAGAGVTGRAGISQNWGETDQDSYTTMADTSRERREMQGTTTNLTQMYNLLTGYHAGTNRVTFLMLPRPHVQPAVRRTFVQGVREIEGVQDFFLTVSRPKHVDSLCIQADLETSHINGDRRPEESGGRDDLSENAQYPDDYDTKVKGLTARVTVDPVGSVTHAVGWVMHSFFNTPLAQNEEKIPAPPNGYTGFEVDGWEFDPSAVGVEPGHGAMSQTLINSDLGTAKLVDYVWTTESPDRVMISGKVVNTGDEIAIFDAIYSIYLRKLKTTSPLQRQEQDKENLLIAKRTLTACISHSGDCIEVEEPDDRDQSDIRIVDDVAIKKSYPSTMSALQQIQSKMTGSAGGLTRRPAGVTSFIDTDYFKNRIRRLLPEDALKKPLAQVSDLPEKVVEKLGKDTSVIDLLDMDLPSLARKAGVNMEEAARVRRRMLGLPQNRPERSTGQHPEEKSGKSKSASQ